ncbi:hypothetical protein [Nostoc sp. 106C]|uniref:hypothetical protein n=1 Tax=Nostoc sp. 106C TaxID=1932667 RepID=UPI0014136AF8|nr:hypothetical protein [Nostoc sp. 106C]
MSDRTVLWESRARDRLLPFFLEPGISRAWIRWRLVCSPRQSYLVVNSRVAQQNF